MHKPDVKVGTPMMLTITNQDARELREAAREMLSETEHYRAGWLWRYHNAHKRAHKVFKRLALRAHT